MSRIVHHTIFENKFLLYDKGPGTLAKRGVGSVEPCGSRLTPSPCSIILPVSLCLNPQEDDAKFLDFTKEPEDGPSQAS